MTIDSKRAQALFLAALEVTDSAARRALLDCQCGSDQALRQRVEELLSADAATYGFDVAPSGSPAITTVEAREVFQPGSILAGRYKLIEPIGVGGMGSVWVAEQKEPVRRKVAIKLIKTGMDSKSVLARFEAERQALAVMDHPNIAKVLDGGLTEQGRPYFVMEYVKGIPITEYCDSRKLSVPERLQLFAQVCHAVQHAHQKGIIHRDLKPSNILVAPYDDKPVPKVIDFGLAKAIHQSLTENTLYTAHDMVLGTPLYMSPEQAQLNNIDIDTRSDVYSLGVLLYELLTGSTPLEKNRFKQAAWDEMRRMIREEDPPLPSHRLSSAETLPSVAAGRHTEPARLTRLVRGELDWIVMKALEKDRTRRYETANGFAADVLRFLSGEPVTAAPPSTMYRFQKFVRRNKGKVIAASLVFSALLAGIAGTSWQWYRAEHSLAEEAIQRKKAEDNERAAESAREEAIAQRARAQEQEAKAKTQAELLRRTTAESALIAGANAFDSDKIDLGRRSLLTAYALSKADPKLNDEVSQILMDRLTAGGKSLFGSQLDKRTQNLVFSPDGKKFATATSGRILRIWDSRSGLPLTEELPHEGPIESIAFHPNGEQVAVLTWYHVQVWDAENGSSVLLPTLLKENEIWRGYKLLFDPEGSRLLVFRSRTGITEGLRRIHYNLGSVANSMAAESGQLLLLDVNRGLPIGEPITHDSEFISSAFASDGNQTATYDLSSIRSIDIRSGTIISEKQLESTGDFGVFDANATTLATWSPKRNTVRIWDTNTGKEKSPPLPQSQDVQRVEFLAADDGIAVTCESHIQYWDNISSDRHRAPGIFLDTSESHEKSLTSPRPTTHEISSYDYFGEELWPRGSRSPDNTQYYSRGSDRLTTLDAALRTPIGRAQYEFEIRNRIMSRDGKYLITLSGWNQNPETECVLRVQNIASGEILGSPIHASGGILSIAMSLDGSLVACTFPNKQVTVWDTSTGKMTTKPIHVNEVVDGMEFSDDNKCLVTQSMPKRELRDRNIEFNDNTFASEICLWETKSGKQLARIFDNNLAEFTREKRAFSSNGKYLAVLSKNHLAHLIHTATGNEVCRIGNDNAIVRAFAFSPNGEYWVTVGSMVEIRRTVDGELVAELADNARNYTAVAFAPDGASFAIGGRVSVQLIEVPSCRPLGVSTRHGDQVKELKFIDDGSRLKVQSHGARTGLFDTSTMELVEQLDFWESSRDGRRLAGVHETVLAERGLERRLIRIWDASHVLRVGSDFELSDLETPSFFEFDKSGSSLAIQTQASLTIWDIRPPVLPTSDSTKQAFFELLSRYTVNENGRTEPLSDADREERYQIVKEDTAFWKANLEMRTERKRRWHAAECNQAIQHRDIATAEFHLRWLRSLTSEEELATIIEPLEGKVAKLKASFVQFQEDLEAAEMAASSADWTEASSLLLRASAFLEKETSQTYRRVAHKLITSLVMKADHDSRQQARQLLFQPEVISPGEPSWNLLFAFWLFQSTANERRLAADESRAWYRDGGFDENEYPNWIIAWASALDGDSETAITALENSVANLWFDEGDLLFLALALKNSEDRAGALTKTRLCRKKFHLQWGDAETIRRRPWQERVCLEMFREYLDQLEKTLN